MEIKELDNGNLLLSFENSDDLKRNFVPFMSSMCAEQEDEKGGMND